MRTNLTAKPRHRHLRSAVVGIGILAVAAGCTPTQMRDFWDSKGFDHSRMSDAEVQPYADAATNYWRLFGIEPVPDTIAAAPSTPTKAPPTTSPPTTTAPPTTAPPSTSGATGFPGPSNTGHVSLTKSGSGLTVTTPGTVIDGYDLTGPITVKANNVTIRNTRIRTSARYGIIPSDSISGLVVEDTTIIGTSFDCSAGIGPDGSWTLRRSDISGCVDGIKVRNNQVVESNWVHDLRIGTMPDGNWSHNDALQSTSGTNVTIRNNNFEVDWAAGANACLMLSSNFGSLSNYRIDGNRFSGGQYVVSIRNQGYGDPSNISITNNTWAYNAWHYGPTNFAGTTVRLGAGNRYDTGQAM